MEAFAGKMAFGTGGLRSVLGVGPARMNVYTVARATQGLAQAILKSKAPHTVAIAYDTRKNSDVFALTAARVLMANGIKAVLWEQPVPTPVPRVTVMLSETPPPPPQTASPRAAQFASFEMRIGNLY